MDRKLLAIVTLLALFCAFGVVSFLVIISRRHPVFIEKKLRIGAIILSLSGFAAGCGGGIGPTCYSPAAPENEIVFDLAMGSSGELVVPVSSADTLTGTIRFRTNDAFSVVIKDGSGAIVGKNNFFPVDGAFDGSPELFRIVFDTSPGSGVYSMELFSCPADSITASTPVQRQFTLMVTD
jgi:hypothetical protein